MKFILMIVDVLNSNSVMDATVYCCKCIMFFLNACHLWLQIPIGFVNSSPFPGYDYVLQGGSYPNQGHVEVLL